MIDLQLAFLDNACPGKGFPGERWHVTARKLGLSFHSPVNKFVAAIVAFNYELKAR